MCGLFISSNLYADTFDSKMYIYKDEDGKVQLKRVDIEKDSQNQLKIDPSIEEMARKKAELAKKPDARIGMTANEVLNHTHWGKPEDIRTTVNAQGKFEQWVYSFSRYLYFKNGRLISIQY